MLVGDGFGSSVALAANPVFSFAFLTGMNEMLITVRADMLLCHRMDGGNPFGTFFTHRTNADFLFVYQLMITAAADRFACLRVFAGNYPGSFVAI
jgi:hypothetical protein